MLVQRMTFELEWQRDCGFKGHTLYVKERAWGHGNPGNEATERLDQARDFTRWEMPPYNNNYYYKSMRLHSHPVPDPTPQFKNRLPIFNFWGTPPCIHVTRGI